MRSLLIVCSILLAGCAHQAPPSAPTRSATPIDLTDIEAPTRAVPMTAFRMARGWDLESVDEKAGSATFVRIGPDAQLTVRLLPSKPTDPEATCRALRDHIAKSGTVAEMTLSAATEDAPVACTFRHANDRRAGYVRVQTALGRPDWTALFIAFFAPDADAPELIKQVDFMADGLAVETPDPK